MDTHRVASESACRAEYHLHEMYQMWACIEAAARMGEQGWSSNGKVEVVSTEPLLNALNGMSAEFLSAVLDSLPVEFTILDAQDNVVFWNRHGVRVFKRGPAVIGRDVRICHPSKSLDLVDKVIEALKSGARNQVAFWFDSPEDGKPRKMLVRYYAVRSKEGEYLGLIETSMDITSLQEFDGENLLGTFE